MARATRDEDGDGDGDARGGARERLLPTNDDRDATTEATRGTEAFREEWGLFFAETFGKAGPIAIGVIAARCAGEALDAFIDAFVSPTIALTLGSRRHGLEEFVFVVGGVRFEYGKFLAACLNAWATVFCVYAAVRVAGWTASGTAASGRSRLWTPSDRCRFCKSWIALDAVVCPYCRNDNAALR